MILALYVIDKQKNHFGQFTKSREALNFMQEGADIVGRTRGTRAHIVLTVMSVMLCLL